MPHDLSESISRLSGPNGPVEEAVSQATGTDHSVPVGCHQNRHHLVRETVQSGASGCESDRNHGSAFNNKPRREAGFICPETPARDRESGARVGKRVRRFERPTFTLATCSHTDLKTSSGPISCDGDKGGTNTATTTLQDEGLDQLVPSWLSSRMNSGRRSFG